MQTKHLCVLIHIWTKGEVGAPLNWFKPSSKIFLLTVPRRYFFCGLFVLFMIYVCVLIHIWTKDEVGSPLNWFKPSSIIFYWPVQGGTSFVDLLWVFFILCLLCLCTCLFICALWSPAGKGLTSCTICTKTINDITYNIACIFIQAASISLNQSKHPYKRKIVDYPRLGPVC